jgi:hypothetical protein
MDEQYPTEALVRSTMKEALLDFLYRVERWEQVCGLDARSLDSMPTDRLRKIETEAEQNTAMRSLGSRLTQIERKLEQMPWAQD